MLDMDSAEDERASLSVRWVFIKSMEVVAVTDPEGERRRLVGMIRWKVG